MIRQDDDDCSIIKIYLNVKDPYEAKYQHFIKKTWTKWCLKSERFKDS